MNEFFIWSEKHTKDKSLKIQFLRKQNKTKQKTNFLFKQKLSFLFFYLLFFFLNFQKKKRKEMMRKIFTPNFNSTLKYSEHFPIQEQIRNPLLQFKMS